MKIHLLWDFLTGSILQLRITPSVRQRRYQLDRPGGRPGRVAVAIDLGYFCLDRFQNLTRAGAFWISRLAAWHLGLRRPGPALGAVAIPAAADRVGTDRRVGPAGREPSPALPIDRSAGAPEVADRRRQKAYVKAQKHGRVPSREYLEWQDWTIFVTNCEPELLTWEAVVVLTRAR